jgi:hypothetical protein
MSSFKDLRRRLLLPVAGAGLAVYYLFVLVPLTHRAQNLDEPLQTAWRKLETNTGAVDFLHITNQLRETRQELGLLENARKKAAARVELSPTVRNALGAAFQLVDYQNERSKQIDELDKRAREQKIAIDPAVFAGFPEHTADIQDPSLLWPALSLTGNLLNAALACKVASLHSLDVRLALTNSLAGDPSGRWTEIPIDVEFTASADNALKLIQSLPLRAEETRAAGLPLEPADKAPLFIERLVMKKQSPDKLDEVRVWLRAIGFVARE